MASNIQEKKTRNKRKFRGDTSPSLSPPSGFENLVSSSLENECSSYDCESDAETLKLELGMSCLKIGKKRVELKRNDYNIDWSDLTESELQGLLLDNFDVMLKNVVKKVVSYGYSEEDVVKAVLRCGFCYGCRDVVANVVRNAIGFLEKGREVETRCEFENLEEMEKSILKELVCVVREARPVFSNGDAMWWLLISDMDVSHSCVLECDALCDGVSNGCFSKSVETQLRKEVKTSDSLPSPCKPDHNGIFESSSKTLASHKGNGNSTFWTMSKSFGLSSQNHEDKPVGCRKINGVSKRDYTSRQRSVRVEKSYRTRGSKGASRAAKHDASSTSTDNPQALSVAESMFSLSLLEKFEDLELPEVPDLGFSTVPKEKSFGRWIPQDKKDETISTLATRAGELQSQLQEWNEWANRKVMQAASRLCKDKGELKILRKEKEQVERLKKEKHTLEQNTVKKLNEMEKAMLKATSQVGRADGTVCRLKKQNADLRVEMEAAHLKAAQSAASCVEVSERAKNTMTQLQLWEKEKTSFQEELLAVKRKLGQVQEDLKWAKERRDEFETIWKQEEKAKQELINQATKIRIERQEGDVKAKSREDLARLKAQKTLQKYKDDIQNLKKEISLYRLKSDSSKIAALKRGDDGSYASKLTDVKISTSPHTLTDYLSKTVAGNGGVKRERECVMCLSEEKSVVFLPCAHQVVCTKCNELHETQGTKDCPTCRGPIQHRLCVRYARS